MHLPLNPQPGEYVGVGEVGFAAILLRLDALWFDRQAKT